MSLEKVLREIKTVKPVAEANLENVPTQTLAGHRGRKMQAQDTLKRLREEYIRELIRGSLFILVAGSAKDAFTSTAKEAFGCFSADSDSFYRELADRIAPVLYEGKESVANLFDVLSRHLEDKANEMNITEYPQIIFKQQYNRFITNKEEFIGLVKQAINEQVGGELVGIHTIHSLVDEAINKEHSAKVTPIVLNTSDDKLALDLVTALKRLTPHVFLVVAGKANKQLKNVNGVVLVKDGDKETVEEALTAIKDSLKNN